MGNGESGMGNRDWDWDRESGAVSGQPKADSRDWGMGIGDSGIMNTKGAVKKWSSFFHSPFFTYPISW